jgi:noranthrone monooxygenase
MMNLFLLTIPVLLETTQQPSQLLYQWSRVYYSGHRKGPAISITTALVYGFAAWSKHAAGSPWRVFAVAGLLTVGMVPYTWIAMLKTNNALFSAEARTKNGHGQAWGKAESLVKTWSRLNAVRALFPLTGAIFGLLGTCKLLVF